MKENKAEEARIEVLSRARQFVLGGMKAAEEGNLSLTGVHILGLERGICRRRSRGSTLSPVQRRTCRRRAVSPVGTET